MPGRSNKLSHARTDGRYVNIHDNDRLIGIAEAATYLGVTKRTVHNMLADGRLKAYRLGGRVVRIRKSAIDAALTDWAS